MAEGEGGAYSDPGVGGGTTAGYSPGPSDPGPALGGGSFDTFGGWLDALSGGPGRDHAGGGGNDLGQPDPPAPSIPQADLAQTIQGDPFGHVESTASGPNTGGGGLWGADNAGSLGGLSAVGVMDEAMAKQDANAETIPGLGLTLGTGWFGFREEAVPDPDVPGGWKADVTWNPGSFIADLIGTGVSLALGGIPGALAARGAQQVAEVALNPGFTATDALALNFGSFPSMLGSADAGGTLYGGGYGDDLGGGYSADPGGWSSSAGDSNGQGGATVPPGEAPPAPAPGLFDQDDTVRSLAPASGSTVQTKRPIWPELLLAGAAILELAN